MDIKYIHEKLRLHKYACTKCKWGISCDTFGLAPGARLIPNACNTKNINITNTIITKLLQKNVLL